MDRKILVIEDDMDICSFISALLKSAGYGVIIATTGAEGISMAASHAPDLILLDLGLPDMDGTSVLKKIYKWGIMPVIIVSARQEEEDIVNALDLGAYDYIKKPFGNSELLARIRSSLRLKEKLAIAGDESSTTFVNGNLMIDKERRRVVANGQAVHLTPIEYKIIILLSQNVGKVITHDLIIKNIWGPYEGDAQVLRVNMANIRRKIEKNPADPEFVKTEVGVGYRMPDYSE